MADNNANKDLVLIKSEQTNVKTGHKEYQYSDIIKAQHYELTLDTAEKFVDRDISFNVTVQDAEVDESQGSGSVVIATASNNANDITAKVSSVSNSVPTDQVYIGVVGSGSSAIKTSGWITAGTDLGEGTGTTQYIGIDKASHQVIGGMLSSTPVVVDGSAKVELDVDSQGVVLKDNNEAEGFKYIKVTGSSDKIETSTTVSRGAIITTHAEGYATSDMNDPSIEEANKTTSVTINAASQEKYIAIPHAVSSADVASVVVGNANNEKAVSANVTIQEPNEGAHFVEISAIGSGSSKIDTAGWIDEGSLSFATSKPSSRYIVLNDASVSNTASEGKTYVEGHSGAVVSGGYLYINEGYIDNTKISLAEIVPDGSNVKGQNELVYKTVTAYDNDGNLVTGSMDDAVLAVESTPKDITINSVSATWEDNKFKLTSEKKNDFITINASTTTTGYAKAGETSAVDIGEFSAAVDASLSTIAGSVVVDSNDNDKRFATPVIIVGNVENAENAADGQATTTAPTNGAYIMVNTATTSNEINVKANITSAGYGNAEHHDIADGKILVGAKASENTYIKVKDAVITPDNKSITLDTSAAPVLQDSEGQDNKYHITVTGSPVTVKPGIQQSGWITENVESVVNVTSSDVVLDRALVIGSKDGVDPITDDNTTVSYYNFMVTEGYVPTEGLKKSIPVFNGHVEHYVNN